MAPLRTRLDRYRCRTTRRLRVRRPSIGIAHLDARPAFGHNAAMSQGMTPAQFIAKWSLVELSEVAASQEHFIDLCRLLVSIKDCRQAQTELRLYLTEFPQGLWREQAVVDLLDCMLLQGDSAGAQAQVRQGKAQFPLNWRIRELESLLGSRGAWLDSGIGPGSAGDSAQRPGDSPSSTQTDHSR
jgi:hypothetical protein